VQASAVGTDVPLDPDLGLWRETDSEGRVSWTELELVSVFGGAAA